MKLPAFFTRHSSLFLMLTAILATPAAYAATLTADPTATDSDGTSLDLKCSLREAIISVNGGADVNTDCVADDKGGAEPYGTNDTILLDGTYNLTITGLDEGWTGTDPNYTVVNTPDATKGDLDIMKSVKIIGTGVGTTTVQWAASVPDTDRDRIFHVYTTATATVDVSFEGLTVTGGRTVQEFIALGPDDPISPTVVDTEFYLRRAGGGIAVGPGANVVQIDPGLSGSENSAGRGGSLRPGESDPGGATFNTTMSNVKVTGNQAQGDGGGIYIASPIMATDITVENNTSSTNGGGIYDEGNTSIQNSTINSNTSEGGGGIFMTGSSSTVLNIAGSTLSGNRAIGGGAISGRSGPTINIINSTISGNLGEDVGAGFYANGPANLAFVTIANNIAGADAPAAGSGINIFPSGSVAVSLKDVLLDNNKKGWDPTLEPNGPADPSALPSANCGYTGGSSGKINSAGHNLSSDLSCTADLKDTTDINDVDPMLGPLANNGGPTQTHELLSGSPAINKGVAITGVTVDQRGTPRDNPPDIGAFEVPASTSTGGGGSSGGCTYDPNGSSDWTLLILLLTGMGGLLIRHRRNDTSQQ